MARVVAALGERGHDLHVFIRDPVPSDGGTGRPAGERVVRVEPTGFQAPRWWKWLERRAGASRIWDKAYAAGNLYFACTPEEWTWTLAAAHHVVEHHRQGAAFQVLLTVLNPHVGHLVGLEVRRRVPELPWSAYFSDPWPHHLYPEPYRFAVGPVSRLRLEGVLRRILERAGSTLFPSRRLADHLLSGSRSGFRNRAFVVPHLTVVREPRSVAGGGKLLVRHAGFLMKERRIEPLFDALRLLSQAHPEVFEALRLEFAGRYEGGQVPEAPEDLAAVVGFNDYISSDEVVEWTREAHVNLLVEAKLQEGVFFPSKLSDYLSNRRPILALSPREGVVSDVLQDGGGVVVEPDDAPGIAEALLTLHDAWSREELDALRPRNAQVGAFSADQVIPVYEKAFQVAMDAVAGRPAHSGRTEGSTR